MDNRSAWDWKASIAILAAVAAYRAWDLSKPVLMPSFVFVAKFSKVFPFFFTGGMFGVLAWTVTSTR
ncbi:hypothetical protein FB451DRAFT_1214878 [Mycena latifolia]|nr:hypothetical protein FB451DRAFT_1214878 [Mycena latifolia]